MRILDVTVEAVEQETGETVEYQERADVVLKQINEQEMFAERLIECLNV